MKVLAALLVFWAAGALIGGCTPVVHVDDLVPSAVAKAPIAIDKTLGVAPVVGGQQSEIATRAVANVEAIPFGDAEVQTLIRAGLFREVSSGESGDLVLHTEIISQEAASPPTVYTLLVHYELLDAATGRLLWRRNIYSDALASDIPHDIIGADWLPRVRGRTVQENLKQLIVALTEDLPRSVPSRTSHAGS
jgi:hypothetical protein